MPYLIRVGPTVCSWLYSSVTVVWESVHQPSQAPSLAEAWVAVKAAHSAGNDRRLPRAGTTAVPDMGAASDILYITSMSFMLLESAAVVLTLLVAIEMRRQRLAWRSVVIRSLGVLGVLTIMIAMWRGR
jgi:hypothetical protein